MGATVAADGTLIPAPEQTLPSVEETAPAEDTEPREENDNKDDVIIPPENENGEETKELTIWPFAAGGVLMTVVIVVLFVIKRKKRFAISESIDEETMGDNGGSEE